MAVRPPPGSEAGNALRAAAIAADVASAAAAKQLADEQAATLATGAAQASAANAAAAQQAADNLAHAVLSGVPANAGNRQPGLFVPVVPTNHEPVTVHVAAPDNTTPAMIIAGTLLILALLAALWCWFRPAPAVAAPVATGPVVATPVADNNKALLDEVKAIVPAVKAVGDKVDTLSAAAQKAHTHRHGKGGGNTNSAEVIAAAVALKLQQSGAHASASASANTGASAYAVAKAYGAPAEGCGVRFAGVTFIELYARPNATCLGDRANIEAKFRAQCMGKFGSEAADRACGSRLTPD